jgi:hypothetical protein
VDARSESEVLEVIAVINDIDRLLQSAPSRFGEAYAPELRLSASDPAFLVALDATVSPSEIVFIASRVGLAEGPVTFSTDTGVPLAVDGDVARLVPAAMVGPTCTVTVTQTWQGQQYTARATVLKTLAFDASTPPAPGGLRTSGTLVSIQLSWDPTNNTNIGKVEVWRALVNDLGEAVPVGETAGLARSFSDSIGAAGEFYYWIRYISKANIPGPFNSEGGTHGATGTDAGDLLELLKDRIGESQLLATLRDRINLIDATAEVAGSVAAQIKAETDARILAIDQEIEARLAALRAEAAAREAYVQGYTYSKVETDSALATQAQVIAAAFTSYADQVAGQAVATAAADVRNYAYSRAAVDASQAEQASTITAAYRSYADSKKSEALTAAAADVRNYGYSRADVDAAEAAQSSAITTAYRSYADGKKDEALTAAAADVRTYAYSKAGTDSAISSMATTLRAEMASSGNVTAAYVQGYTYSKAEFDNAQAGQSTTLTTGYQQYADARKAEAISASAADVRNYSYSKSDVDGGFATQFNTLTANYQAYANAARDNAVQVASADVRSYAYSKAATDGAIASATSTLQSTVNGHTTAIQAHQESIDGVTAQVFLKIDNNGYSSGWGLSSTPHNGVPTSEFAILADSFKIGFPGYGAVRMFYVDALGAYMDTAIIRQLEVTKITSGSMNAEWRISGQNGRIVMDNGSVMKVIGTGFGANRDLIEWFGPSMAIDQCTRQNATIYTGTDGSAYYGGALRAGTLYNAQRTTQTVANAQVPLGPFWSNGNPRALVVSYTFDWFMQNRNIGSSGYQYNGGDTYADIQLLKGNTVIASARITGSYVINNESDGPDSARISMGGSFTFTDTGPAGNYTYTAVIVARSTASITHTSGASTSSNVSQSLGIVSTEE